MEIRSVQSFLKYYAKIKNRTRKLFDFIPEDKIEWTYKKGKFTMGDIIRHLANIERMMYAENVQQKPSLYRGCDTSYANGFENVIKYYNDQHKASMAIFSKLSDEDLLRKCKTPAGIEITTWKWMRAMVEHEIHHRGQIYMYLGMLNIVTPPVFGLTSEEVAEKSSK